MSEAAFIYFNMAYAVAAELIYAACLALFLCPFMTGRGRGALVFVSGLLLRLICDTAAIPQGAFGLLLVLLPTAAAGLLGIERAMAFLLALLYWNARTSSGLMAQSVFHFLEHWIPTPITSREPVYLYAAALLVLFLVLHTTLLTVMLFIFQRQVRKQRFPLHRRELCYSSLVPVAGILFGQVISKLLIESENGVPLFLYERHPAFLAVVPVLALLFYAGACLTIAFQQGMAALREEQAAWLMERQQAQAIRTRLQEAEEFYARVRELKHEMRGHLTNIKGLVLSGEYASLEAYISQLDESMSGFALIIQTGNPVTDVIVNDVRRRSQEQGVRFQADFHYPDPAVYDAFDVGIILQNLLQNAMEACEKVDEGGRFITLAGRRKGRFFLIEVKNAFTGEVVFGPDGLPVTAKKEDVLLHGVGLSNVRREAEKYMGELELRADREEFSATVLLQERSDL